MKNGIIISTQTPIPGEKFPRPGGTAWAIQQATGLPTVKMHLDAKPVGDEVGDFANIENNGIIFITGHGNKERESLQGAYLNPQMEESVSTKWSLSDYRDLILNNTELKEGDNITIVLWSCYGGYGETNSTAAKLSELFREKGIQARVVANNVSMDRYNPQQHGADLSRLEFLSRGIENIRVFDNDDRGIVESRVSSSVYFDNEGMSALSLNQTRVLAPSNPSELTSPPPVSRFLKLLIREKDLFHAVYDKKMLVHVDDKKFGLYISSSNPNLFTIKQTMANGEITFHEFRIEGEGPQGRILKLTDTQWKDFSGKDATFLKALRGMDKRAPVSRWESVAVGARADISSRPEVTPAASTASQTATPLSGFLEGLITNPTIVKVEDKGHLADIQGDNFGLFINPDNTSQFTLSFALPDGEISQLEFKLEGSGPSGKVYRNVDGSWQEFSTKNTNAFNQAIRYEQVQQSSGLTAEKIENMSSFLFDLMFENGIHVVGSPELLSTMNEANFSLYINPSDTSQFSISHALPEGTSETFDFKIEGRGPEGRVMLNKGSEWKTISLKNIPSFLESMKELKAQSLATHLNSVIERNMPPDDKPTKTTFYNLMSQVDIKPLLQNNDWSSTECITQLNLLLRAKNDLMRSDLTIDNFGDEENKLQLSSAVREMYKAIIELPGCSQTRKLEITNFVQQLEHNEKSLSEDPWLRISID